MEGFKREDIGNIFKKSFISGGGRIDGRRSFKKEILEQVLILSPPFY
jgi:hypothetical protein